MADIVADCLTRMRNAQRAGHRSVVVRRSKLVESMLQVLQKEGFIERVTECQSLERKGGRARRVLGGSARRNLQVVLKYFPSGEPTVRSVRRMSTSGRRLYVGYKDLPKVASGLGLLVLSTSQGVMSDRDARRSKLGGEVLALLA